MTEVQTTLSLHSFLTWDPVSCSGPDVTPSPFLSFIFVNLLKLYSIDFLVRVYMIFLKKNFSY